MTTKKIPENLPLQTLSAIVEVLERAPSWIILTHTRPDGDTLGSGSALLSLGRSLDKKVFWGGPDIFAVGYAFLPGSEEYLPGIDPAKLLGEWDGAVIVIDTATEDRSVPGIRDLSRTYPVVNIDHHLGNERFGSVNWIDPSASSTGEMLWNLLSYWRIPYPLSAAEGLYTAITTDSGNFTFSSTSETTHRAAGDLLSRGVSPEKIENLIRSNRSLSVMHLWGRAFERTEIHASFAAVTWLALNDFTETGAALAETEFLVNELLTLKGISFAAFLLEEEDAVRVSLRSRGDLSAVEIAKICDGGGHLQAAGCRLPLPLEKAKMTLLQLLEETNAMRTASSR